MKLPLYCVKVKCAKPRFNTEIKLRAERKAGRVLSGMDKNKGGNPNRSPDVTSLKLNDLGLSPSSKWQKGQPNHRARPFPITDFNKHSVIPINLANVVELH